MRKIITWVDIHGRYRMTSPAYGDTKFPEQTDEEFLQLAWAKVVQSGADLSGPYGITTDHPHFLLEIPFLRERLDECCNSHFRFGVWNLPNPEGITDHHGKVLLRHDARDGAWEMDTDGRPKVNMPKARGIQMDWIRKARILEFDTLDALQNRAVGRNDIVERDRIEALKQVLRDIPQTFDLTTDEDTPEKLKAKWPTELPARE